MKTITSQDTIRWLENTESLIAIQLSEDVIILKRVGEEE